MNQIFLKCANTKWDDMAEAAKQTDRDNVRNFSRFGRVDSDAQLCAIQAEQRRAGYIMAAISTNIYGFCLRDTDNNGAGRISPNFNSAAEVLEFARQWYDAAPEQREVIVHYVGADRRAELDAALALEVA